MHLTTKIHLNNDDNASCQHAEELLQFCCNRSQAEINHLPTSKRNPKEERNMETKQKIRLLLFATLGTFLIVASSGAETYQFVCGQQRTISDAVRHLRPSDTLFVNGAC